MILCPRLMLLQREPVEIGNIANMRRCPAVRSITNIGGRTFLTRCRDGKGDESLLAGIVNLWQAHHRRAKALRQLGKGCFFRNSREWKVGRHDALFLPELAPPSQSRQSSRDDQGPPGTRADRAPSLDTVFVC